MKKNLQKLMAAAGFLFTAGLFMPAQATHWQGSEMSYSCVAPNIYVVNLKLFRDCYGVQVPNTAILQVKAPGCNNGRAISMNKVGNTRIGADYCATLGAPTCSHTGPSNYEEVNYSTTVTFSAAEAQCPDWVLSWSDCCWPNSGNVLSSQGNNNYTENHLKLGTQGTVTANLNNNSPFFPNPITRFINQNQPIMLSTYATDQDGDSLVYSLVAPLHATNTPITGYANYAPQGGMLFNPQDSTQFAFIASANQALSGTFPIPSYFIDWTQPAPRYATKSFVLDPQNGTLLFTAPALVPTTSPVSGLNKYIVAVRVDEYRKLGGNPVKIGSIRRDMMIEVIDCGPNQNPLLAAPVANGQPLTSGAIINLRPGTPLTFTFAADDNNANDVLTMESNMATKLPKTTFIKTSNNRPTGTVTWTPTAAHARDQIYYFSIIIQDDACPVKGQRVETFGVRVSNNGGVTGISKGLNAQPTFTAFPNPFASEITFKVKQTAPQQQILIYNVLGQQVDQIILKGQLNAEQEVAWTNAGKFPAGQYLARFSGNAGASLKINKLQ